MEMEKKYYHGRYIKLEFKETSKAVNQIHSFYIEGN